MTEQTHEYAVRECSNKAKEREGLLNHMAGDGWEPFAVRQAGIMEWNGKDLITFRRELRGA